MSFDRDEFMRLNSPRAADRADEATIHRLRQIRQGSVLADNITNSPHWDQFLSLIQGEIEALRELRKQAQSKALSATPMPGYQRDGHRVEALRLETAIETLENILELPKALHDDAAKANDILQRRDAG